MSRSGVSGAALGAVLLVTSWAFFTVEMVYVRLLSDSLSIAQIAFFRQLTQAVVFLPALLILGARLTATSRLPLHGLRALCSSGAMALFYLAYALLPLATATTLTFMQAMFMTLLAALVLGEKIGVRRVGAVIAGLIGVLIVMRPGLATFEPGALVALAGAFVAASLFIVTRQLTATESRYTVMFYSAAFGTLATAGPAAAFWVGAPLEHWPVLLTIGLCGTMGQFLMVGAVQLSEASALAPFDYVRLVFAIIAGYAVFGEFPDIWTWIGAFIIIASAAYTAHREQQIAQRRDDS